MELEDYAEALVAGQDCPADVCDQCCVNRSGYNCSYPGRFHQDQRPETRAGEMARATQANWIYGILAMIKSRKLHEHTSLSPFRLICIRNALDVVGQTVQAYLPSMISKRPSQANPDQVLNISFRGSIGAWRPIICPSRPRPHRPISSPEPVNSRTKWHESRRFTADSLSVAQKTAGFRLSDMQDKKQGHVLVLPCLPIHSKVIYI